TRIVKVEGKEIAIPPTPGFEVTHSVTIMHVNAEGRVLGMYNALNDVEMARLRRVFLGRSDASDAALIEKDDEQSRGAEARKRELQARAEGRFADGLQPNAAPDWVLRLPAVNASLNGLATVLLLVGYALIKARRPEAHQVAMLTAFATSILFLGF